MTSFSQRAITMAASVSDGLPPLQIEDFKSINKESFALIVSTHNSSKDYNFNDYHEALASMTDTKLGLVEGSMFRLDGYKNPIYRCIAAANREVLPYNESEIKKRGMFETVANLVEDSNGHIWRIVGTGDTKQIVQVTEDDFSDLLANRRRRAQMTASVDDSTNIQFIDTDYLYFFNPKIEAMDFGFAVKSGNNIYAFSRELKDAVSVQPYQIIAAVPTNGHGLNLSAKRRELTAGRGNSSMNEWLSYLRELYGKASEYVKLWEKTVRTAPNFVR